MLNFEDKTPVAMVVYDAMPEGTEPEEKGTFDENALFAIEEHPESDTIEIFPMRSTLELHGELEVKILIKALKKYLRR